MWTCHRSVGGGLQVNNTHMKATNEILPGKCYGENKNPKETRQSRASARLGSRAAAVEVPGEASLGPWPWGASAGPRGAGPRKPGVKGEA